MLVFQKILRTYLMDGPLSDNVWDRQHYLFPWFLDAQYIDAEEKSIRMQALKLKTNLIISKKVWWEGYEG